MDQEFGLLFRHGRSTEGRNEFLRSVAQTQLTHVLRREKQLIEEGHRIDIVALEEDMEPYTLSTDPQPVRLAGRVDRIDRLDGQLRIIDYKTGRVDDSEISIRGELDEQNMPGKWLQLMCYTLIFRRLHGGAMSVKGRPMRFRSPREAVAAGIGFLTSDRNASGIWRDFTIAENIGLGALGRFCRGGFISRGAVVGAAGQFARDFNIRCQGVEDPVGTLSGGNAQKVAIAKVLAAKPSVLVLNELTQGVDVGARQEIYALLGQLASNGMAVVLVSSDMTELLGLCRRIAVMREGRIVGEVSGDRLTEKDIIRLATGTEEGSRKDN